MHEGREGLLKSCSLADRPELLVEFERLADLGWPRFMLEWRQPGGLPGRREFLTEFADYQLALFDDAGRLMGVGNTLPLVWDGTVPGLPESIQAVKRNAWEARGTRANALCAIAALVEPQRRGQGARALLEAMSALAGRKGLEAFLAPVRPTLKAGYPREQMESYVRRKDDAGRAFDPWLRTHERLGAEFLAMMPRALSIEAGIGDWEAWTGLRFPESGEYVVPEGLAPLSIDRERGIGRYVEPNVWMRHPGPQSQLRKR
ncbi:MAG: hypothetical protein HYZ75_15560 [Elusimicrobia bacterium]|nr:hypothetical protein [Elusimicrobiota bacterium]